MTRTGQCPLCGKETDLVLQLHFNKKVRLPTEVEIRHCDLDNFLFVASGDQHDYDEYYRSLANDSYHSEVAGANLHSPISMLQRSHLVKLLGGFFDRPRMVLDFGCGEASLLIELASEFASSTFVGFDPAPSAQLGSNKAKALGLRNSLITDLEADTKNKDPYDLVIISHVVEHLLEFDVLRSLSHLMVENGLLYVEVPDSLQYESYPRREFLYYFDRLHVNHFTPHALARLCAAYGFGYACHVQYDFPYRDAGRYPALGMLFRKGGKQSDLSSPGILEAANRYVAHERHRAEAIARTFDEFGGILVWGAGDNFFRSTENGGPFAGLSRMVVLDRIPREIAIGNRKWTTEDPEEGIRRYPWPVVITVSEGGQAIREQVERIDASRAVFFA